MTSNVVLIINDSMRYETIGDDQKRWGKTATPFIDSIKNNCLIANNMYSQGPYTEAAIKALITGRDLLDDGGYLYRFHNSPSTIFEPFHAKGYETFYTCCPDFLFSKEQKTNIDHCWYAEMPMFADFFTFRLDVYYKKIKKESLPEDDLKTLISLFEIHFDLFIDFFDEFRKNPEDERYTFVKNRLKCYSVDSILSVWKKEQQNFLLDKKKYIIKTLQQEQDAPIYKIASDLWSLENKDAPLKALYEENKDVEEYVKSSIERSIYKYNVDIKENDNLITLITCTRLEGYADKEFVINAREVRKKEGINNYHVEETSNYEAIKKILEKGETHEKEGI